MLAEHNDNIGLNPKLFERVKAVYDKRASLALGREELFLLENTYKDFVRGGALLDEAQKARFRELNQELSLLSLKFGENVLAETNAFQLVIDNKADLAGLPPSVVAMAAAAAKQAGLADGKWLFTIQVPSMTPFLTYSERRPLREKIHRAYFMKGDNDNEFDNKETLRKIAALRLERAKLLGYPSHAAFVLEENMAKTPEKVNEFLAQLWEPTNVKAKEEAAALQALMDRDPRAGKAKLASWDWWLYTERLRQEKYALDDSALRPYFKLDNVRDGIFALCDKLYGLKFIEKPDLPRYHPDVQVFEVQEADGRHTGVLYMDFHPRPSKRSGAWSGGFRRAYYEAGVRVPPISTITCNFTAPTADAPALLSIDEVETFFHEFGHSLATLFSQGRYRSRTVARDSVELPSQIMEHWVLEPELLAIYAKHYKTGETIPADLVEKLEKSSLFNQGFITAEYLAASILDMAWHTAPRPGLGRRPHVRAGGHGQDRPHPRDRAALPLDLLQPHLQRRLFGRLLRLHLVGGPRLRRLRGVQGEGHLRPGHGRFVPQEHPRAVRHRGPDGPVRALPRRRAQDRRAAPQPRAGDREVTREAIFFSAGFGQRDDEPEADRERHDVLAFGQAQAQARLKDHHRSFRKPVDERNAQIQSDDAVRGAQRQSARIRELQCRAGIAEAEIRLNVGLGDRPERPG